MWTSRPPELPPSAHGKDNQGLVVKATDAFGSRNLPVGVEAGHGRSAGVRGDSLYLAPDTLIAEDTPPRDAIKSNDPERSSTLQGLQCLGASSIRRFEDRPFIAGHEPGQPALRHLGDADEGSLLEVRLADETYLEFLAPAAKTEGMRRGQARECGRVGPGFWRSLQTG